MEYIQRIYSYCELIQLYYLLIDLLGISFKDCTDMDEYFDSNEERS